MKDNPPKMVHVWQLRCWNCMLLKKDFAKNTHSCLQNVFKDSELYPEFFAEKCGKFEPIKKES
jgi:lipid A disaccharide synthetase